MNGMEIGKQGYYFVSKNGIYYDLLEGVSIGGKRHTTSCMIFIVLWTFNEDLDVDDDLMKLMDGSSIKVIDLFSSSMLLCGDPSYIKDDEKYIRHIVDKFENANKELIDFINNHHIPTSSHECI